MESMDFGMNESVMNIDARSDSDVLGSFSIFKWECVLCDLRL